jgi:hypothetical protein
MACKEKERLSKEYKAALSAFSAAVQEFHAKIGIAPQGEYQRLRDAAEEARSKKEKARISLEQHLASHGC